MAYAVDHQLNRLAEPLPSVRRSAPIPPVATLRWKNAAGATAYVLQVGGEPGRSDLFNGNVGNTRTVKANVAQTPIYVRVIGVNACGQSAASAEVRVP